MKKDFDEIILDLPEINLNEKRTRYGDCAYGIDPWGNCFGSPQVTVTGTGGGPRWLWVDRPRDDGRGGSDAQVWPSGGGGGYWVDQPCVACSDLEANRPVTQRGLGTYLRDRFAHNNGCGGQSDPNRRHQVWQSCD